MAFSVYGSMGRLRRELSRTVQRLVHRDPDVILRFVIQANVGFITSTSIIKEYEVSGLPERRVIDELRHADEPDVVDGEARFLDHLPPQRGLQRLAQLDVTAGHDVLATPLVRLHEKEPAFGIEDQRADGGFGVVLGWRHIADGLP